MADLRVLRAGDRRSIPWKNGGGMTAVVATFPADDNDDWEWRISLATVAQAGPFSRFDGVDRVLLLLSGALDLAIAPMAARRLAPGDMVRFAGDIPAFGSLCGAPATDLNVMTKRGRWTAAVDRLTPGTDLSLSTETSVLFFPDGGTLSIASTSTPFLSNDAALLTGTAHCGVRIAGDAVAYRISLEPIGETTCRL